MKHPALLTKNKTGLLIVDVQEKFGPAISDYNTIVANITKLALGFQLYKMPCMVTEQYPQGLGPTAEPIKRMFPILEIIEKIEFACTDNAEFLKALNPLKLETLVVCGVESHVCISQTVLGLLAKKMTVHVVVDAIGSRQSLDHLIALKKMEAAGAIMTTTEMCLFELCEQAGTESFKTIQKAIKIKGPIVLQNPTIEKSTPPPVQKAAAPKTAPVDQTIAPEKPAESIPLSPQSAVSVAPLIPTTEEPPADFEITIDQATPPLATESAPPVDIAEESLLNNSAQSFAATETTLASIENDLDALNLNAATANQPPDTPPAAANDGADEINLEDINSLLAKDGSSSANG